MKILFVSNDFSGFGGIQQVVRDFLAMVEPLADLRVAMCKGNSFVQKVFFVLEVFCQSLFHPPEFIIYNHINYSPVALVLFRITKIPYALMIYGTDAWDLRNKMKVQAMRKAHSIISSSRFTQSVVEKQPGILSTKFFIMEPTIDTGVFSVKNDSEIMALRASQGLSDKKIILYVGRLSKKDQYKGYDLVVKALPAVLKRIPNAMYVIFGAGDDMGRVKELVTERSLEGKVVFSGISDEKKIQYYQSADVFIMPSTGEGFGIVYLEALSCGTPVIAGDIDASSEPLLGGELGLLIDPRDVQQIANSLITVLSGEANPLFYRKAYLHDQVVKYFGHLAFQERVRHYVRIIEHELQR